MVALLMVATVACVLYQCSVWPGGHDGLLALLFLLIMACTWVFIDEVTPKSDDPG